MPEKIKLQQCTADTVLEDPDHGPTLIRIHQAVNNPSSKASLLSEYQLSEGGCLIDAKPLHHTYPDGRKGIESIQLPQQSYMWIFNVESCLMTLPQRLPTLEECETLTPVQITRKEEWVPSTCNATTGKTFHPLVEFALQVPSTVRESNVLEVHSETFTFNQIYSYLMTVKKT